jgi:purine nucleoside permease
MSRAGVALMRVLTALVASLTLAFAGPANSAAPRPIEVRIVVVTTWEYERDGKDLFGELHAWKERWPLATTLPFPAGVHTLHYDPKTQVLALVTGMATGRAAASTMALGLDPRFDLSRAYWVVAGIAGVNPKSASIGSAAWARWIVDGDLAQEIDLRDAPADWPTGIVPHCRATPYELPAPPYEALQVHMAYPLNPALVDWAFNLTRGTKLADDAKIAAARAPYGGEAAKPPAVLKGDAMMSSRFWYGPRLNERAERWVDYWTGGKGVFTMAAEEDSGILLALTQLAGAGRVKLDRVLVLRAASDYTVGPPGANTAQVLADMAKTGPPGMVPALENLYRVAAPVVRYLSEHWATTRDTPPGGSDARDPVAGPAGPRARGYRDR